MSTKSTSDTIMPTTLVANKLKIIYIYKQIRVGKFLHEKVFTYRVIITVYYELFK